MQQKNTFPAKFPRFNWTSLGHTPSSQPISVAGEVEGSDLLILIHGLHFQILARKILETMWFKEKEPCGTVCWEGDQQVSTAWGKKNADGGKEQAVTWYAVFLPWSYFDNYKIIKKSKHILFYGNWATLHFFK